MRFALLDPDDDALALAEALVRAFGHELTAYVSTFATPVAALAALSPDAARLDEWEGVLAGTNDFVLVGTAGPAGKRFEQLRRLVLENEAVVFVHPFSLAPLEYHELDMNRQATGTALVPYEPLRRHAAARDVEVLSGVLPRTESPGIGRLEQIVVERQARVRSRSAAIRHFVRDVGLVLGAVGPCSKVSALGKVSDDGPDNASVEAGHLGIQITTDDDVLIRWSIGAVVDAAGAKTTLVGADGNAVVSMPDSADWSLLVRRGDVIETVGYDSAAPREAAALEAVPELVRAVANPTDDKLWREALAEIELVEAVERSMRRGRTVELYHEEASEQGTFHGVMAAVGCLLIMLAIGLAIMASIFGTFRLWIANLWPYALLALLLVFLLMQFLKFVFPSKDPND